MRRMAIALSKGGVGKTTTAVNLAHGLSRRGRRVLLVDMDTQGQASFALGVRPEKGLAEAMSGEKAQEVVEEARENLFLLSGGRRLAEISMAISRRQLGVERALMETLNPIEKEFDFVLMDMAPGWDLLSVNALFFADEVLCPVSLEIAAVQGLVEFIARLEDVKKYKPDLTLRHVVPTFMDRRLKRTGEILGQLEDLFPEILRSPIRLDVRLSECFGHGETIFEYAPDSKGAEDYEALIEEVNK